MVNRIDPVQPSLCNASVSLLIDAQIVAQIEMREIVALDLVRFLSCFPRAENASSKRECPIVITNG